MDIRWIAIAAVLPLTACAGAYGGGGDMGPPPPADMVCNADAVQSYVGQSVSAELGAAALRASGARTLRWGPPRSAMTMDYREDRLNIMYDDASKVTQVSCG
ncbi:hypothetical protein K5P26_08675 [Sphingopyxis sp. XHP0097]|uniref:Peptidase inhibitor I78 family protein n=1 Tax=Sphingopyxis jiangsuensis TaxID=2871171 RepID=A0ABS7MDV7_9SPHN|nr:MULTISPECIES: I78 family peptidase inhibitor [Sphingopyxis]MBL0769663.1 hypothetical protein [Sphingopyxis lutea]MBY4637208.1 hypothetical protein [Sphingopyxis jiangsuensis]